MMCVERGLPQDLLEAIHGSGIVPTLHLQVSAKSVQGIADR
jgi:hypothetical protein